jgi:cytidine deaminase
MARISRANKHNAGKAEIKLTLSETACGSNFTFTLHGNHIEVSPTDIANKSANYEKTGWDEALNETERLAIFNEILAEYRERSLGDENFKLAALGITEQGRIYISENTEQLSSDFNRQCAEQNMVTISTQRDVYDQIMRRVRTGEDPKAFKQQNPKYRAIYLMGGRLPEIPIACPCGNCTDLLAKVMLPDSNIWILPVNDGKRELTINDNVQMAKELKPGEAWKTSIAHLNRDREIPLDKKVAGRMRDEMKQALNGVREWSVRNAEENPNIAMGQPIFDLQKMADVIRLKRMKSVEMVDHGKLKTYLHDMVMVTLANRLEEIAKRRGLPDLAQMSDEQIEALAATDALKTVRCVVVQRDDGSLSAAVDVKSSLDKAAPDAEISAIAGLRSKLGSQGIRQAWAMEFDMANAREGIVRTSSKAAVERLIKVPSVITGRVDFGFFPFDTQPMEHKKAAEQSINRTGEQLSPGYYTGKTRAQSHGHSHGTGAAHNR